MRVAVVAGPDPGHSFPAIALCRRFSAAGDTPTLLTGTEWLETARAAGVDAGELAGLDPTDEDDDRDAGAAVGRRAAPPVTLSALYMAIIHAVAGPAHTSAADHAVAACVGAAAWAGIVAAYQTDWAARGEVPPHAAYLPAPEQERLLHPRDYADAPGGSLLPAAGPVWHAVNLAAERVRQAGLLGGRVGLSR